MSIVYHPAFQSLATPLLATLLAIALLSIFGGNQGQRWAAFGAVVGLLISLALLPGFEWPATARTQKLPWIALAGAALAVVSMALANGRGGRWGLWVLGTGLWVLASVWLAAGEIAWPALPVAALAGAVVLGLLLLTRPSAHGSAAQTAAVEQQAAFGMALAAALAVASVGQAAMAALGGSLLLAQLALMLGAVTGALALWAWARPASHLLAAPLALFPLGLAWLSLAQSLVGTVSAGAVRCALLALAFFVAPALGRTAWADRHPRWWPWVAVLLSAVPVVLALLPMWGDMAPGSNPSGAGASDDLYYRPGWE